MKKRFTRKLSYFVLLALIFQIIFPSITIFAETTNSSVLPPSNLQSLFLTPDDVRLTWSSVHGATGYNIYEITEGQLILLGSTSSTSYNLNDLAEGTYRYVVSTLSAEGESGPSAPVSFDIVYPELVAPNLSYTIQNGNDIALSWTASQHAEAYHLYQISVDGEATLLTTRTSRNFTVSNAPEGHYTYAVSATHNLYGESLISAPVEVEVVYPIMTAPTNFRFTVANISDVTLRWDSVPFATSYNIYQIVDGHRELSNTITSTLVRLTNVPPGDYLYEVRSNSTRFGESTEGSQLAVSVSDVAMEAPSNLSISLQNGNDIVLSWSSATNATGYKVYQVIDGQPVLQSTVTRTNVTFSNMPAGDYVYQVHSYSDRFGESEEGSQASITVGSISLDAPGNLKHSIQNGNDIVLIWDSVLNADNYRIYQIVNGEKILRSTRTQLNVSYTNMPAGEYVYEVHANSSRFGEAEQSSRIAFQLVHPTMQAPESLIQTIKSATEFTLSWEAVEYATNYRIYEIVNGEKVLRNTRTATNVTYSSMAPGEYTYEVHSNSSRFGESAEGARITIVLNGQTMQPPTNPTYTIANGNDVTLRWTAAEYATNYKIYQVVDGEKTLLNTRTQVNVTLTNQPEGDNHYVIHSFSTLLGESPEGTEIVVPIEYPVMQAPGNLTYSVVNGNDITLSWAAVTYVTNYRLYQLIDGKATLIRTQTNRNYTISNMPEGEYTFEVRSYSDRFGESPAASRVSLSLEHSNMEAPGNLTYSIANGNDITLRWDAVENVTNYRIYQMIEGEETLIRTQTGRNYTLTNMPEGVYTFKVRAYSDRFGESKASQISLTLVHPIMEAPGNFTYSIANGNDITLRWDAASYITNYRIYQVIDGETTLIRTQTGRNYTLTNMPEGDYTFEVRSFSNRFGESPDASSLSVTLTWPIVQPPVVTGTVFNANNITLTWPTATWANSYRVYKVEGTHKQLIYQGTARTHHVYNLAEETHTFEVTSVSTRFGESEPSNQIIETIVYPIMQPPVANLTLLSETSARISWDFITYANGYNIYEIIDGEHVLIAENVNNLSFTLTNLTYTNHHYVVTSYSNSFGESEPSNIVFAELVRDTEPPVTLADAPEGWTNQGVIVNLVAIDNESGVDNTFYSLNDGSFISGTSIEINNEGIHKLSFYSVDKVGNKEDLQTINIKIDYTAPATVSNITEEWQRNDFNVILTAEDNLSGASKTFYSVNNGDFNEGTNFVITDEGVHTITYYSVDLAGNSEEVKVEQIKIDKTAPTVVVDYLSQYALGTELELTYIAEDNLSGIAQEILLFNGQEYNNGDVVLLDQPGIYTLQISVTDHAGWSTIVEHTIHVYLTGTVEVTPKVLQPNTGEFTVRVTLPLGYSATDFDLNEVTLDGISAINKGNGSVQQAKQGMFKFNRNDFTWDAEEVILEFRGVVDGQLFIGNAHVIVQVNGNNQSNGKK